MTMEVILLPLLIGAAGYILYQIRTFLQCLFFASVHVEELGCFMEAAMSKLRGVVWNPNWTIGRYSMVKKPSDNIRFGREKTEFSLDSGFYIGRYKGTWILVVISDVHYQGFGDYLPRHPGIRLISWRWSSKVLWDFIKEVKKEELPIDEYATGWNSEVIRGRKRSGFDGVFLPQGVKEEIMTLVQWFCSEEGEQWYRDMHQPYKLVLMFHGSAGSGKTAIARAIADHSQRSLSHIRLVAQTDQRDISHETVAYVCGCRNSVILMDEIDKLFLADTAGHKVDPATLLQLLNGDLLYGHIIVLTANDLSLIPETFRGALLRSRRIDRIYEFQNPDQYQKQQACEFYGVQFDEEIDGKETMACVMDAIMQRVEKPKFPVVIDAVN